MIADSAAPLSRTDPAVGASLRQPVQPPILCHSLMATDYAPSAGKREELEPRVG